MEVVLFFQQLDWSVTHLKTQQINSTSKHLKELFKNIFDKFQLIKKTVKKGEGCNGLFFKNLLNFVKFFERFFILSADYRAVMNVAVVFITVVHTTVYFTLKNFLAILFSRFF